jgi:hypothetical protein
MTAAAEESERAQNLKVWGVRAPATQGLRGRRRSITSVEEDPPDEEARGMTGALTVRRKRRFEEDGVAT